MRYPRQLQAPPLQGARDDTLGARERVFWELSDQVVDFDCESPERRLHVITLFERPAALRAKGAYAS